MPAATTRQADLATLPAPRTAPQADETPVSMALALAEHLDFPAYLDGLGLSQVQFQAPRTATL